MQSLDFSPTLTLTPAFSAASIEIEEHIIGGILLDPNLIGMNALVADLPPEAFELVSHQRIWRQIVRLHQEGYKADPNTLALRLTELGILQELGGKCKLAQMMGRVVTSCDIPQYVATLLEGYQKRRLIDSLAKIPQVLAGGGSIDEAIEKVNNCLAGISQKPNNSTEERFKADLLTLVNIDDPLIQLLKINELASIYRMPASEIRKALARTESATRTPKSHVSALDGFISMETEGIDYLIPGLLPRGETVLCVGLPKSGKTLLAIDAGFAIATGESDFLGETVTQGRVLLVSCDESPQSTRAKLLRRGFRSTDAANVTIMTHWDISQLDTLEAVLEDFRPDLVIIDSLKRITVGREISENSAEFADIIYTLKELTGRYNAASILIHHTNKNSEATGISRVRGSTAIAGAVWGVWDLTIPESEDESSSKGSKGALKRFDPTNPNRVFTAICRDTEGASLNIRFNPENHSYSISEGDESVQSERKTQQEAILAILAQTDPKGLTGREIMTYSGLGRSIYSVLNRMVDKRLITQRQSITDARMTVYCLPKKQRTHTPPYPVPLCDQYSLNPLPDKDLEIDHKLITTRAEIDHNFEEMTKNFPDVINSNLDLATVSVEIDHKKETAGGVCVATESVVEAPASDQLRESTEMLTELAYDLDQQTLQELIAAWTDDYKQSVWALLSEDIRQRLNNLAQQSTSHLSATTSHHEPRATSQSPANEEPPPFPSVGSWVRRVASGEVGE